MAFFLRKLWRQKPPESWQIDWGHPLADGLASFITADGDHVSGYPLVLMGSARRQADGTMYSPGGSSDGAYVLFNPFLLNIGTELTVLSFCRMVALQQNGKFISLPYYNGTWASPFVALNIGNYGSTSSLSGGVGNSSGFTQFYTQGYLDKKDTESCYAFSKTSASLIFYNEYKYTSSFSYNLGSSLNVSPNFVNLQPIVIGNASNSNNGSPVKGFLGPQVIYSRALSVAELAAINENPWQIFAPRRLYCALSVTSSPAAEARVTTARMASAAGPAQARPIVAGSPAGSLLHPAAPASVAEVATRGATVATHLPAVVNAGAPHGAARAAAAPAMSAVVARTGLSAFASALAGTLPAFVGATPGGHAGTPVAIVVPDAAQAALAARAAAAAAATTAGATAAVLRLLARSLAGDIVIREVARLASPITTTVRGASPVAVAIRLASPIETEQA